MLGGYMGKFLWINLSTRELREEIPDEKIIQGFLGGYGIGARILYDHIPPHIDPLDTQILKDFKIGSISRGRRVRRSTISTSIPSLDNSSAALREVPNILL